MKIIFEFTGGPLDGKTVEGESGEQDEADRYFALTHHGKVGQRFRIGSEYAIDLLAAEGLKEDRPHHFRRHNYDVTDRLEGDDEVLIRAEYVEGEDNKRDAVMRRHWSSLPQDSVPVEQTIANFLQQTAKAIGNSYSHYWPADEAKRSDAAQRNVALHLAHVLLNQNFSVFAQANHPEPPMNIDLLGIAPSQDWFLVCECQRLYGAGRLQCVLDDVQRLETFWLSARLTIEACGEHVVRLADHCECGYGVVAGLHWVPEPAGRTKLFEFWRDRRGKGRVYEAFAQKLAELNADWQPPILVRRFDGRGAYYLLSCFFRIVRQRP
jgi:hypothetical protein